MCYLHKVVHLIGLVLLCASCSAGEGLFTVSPTQTLTPLIAATATQIELVRPTSSFPGIITGVERINGQLIAIRDEVCVWVDENWLWKPGYFWGGNSPQLNISVNGSEITIQRRYVTGPLTTVFDKAHKISGTHGSSIETCILLKNLSTKPNNTMSIAVVFEGKTLLSDSWAFSVADQK
jgi:hypothetical protein